MTDLFYQTNQTFIMDGVYEFCMEQYGQTPDLTYWADNFFGYEKEEKEMKWRKRGKQKRERKEEWKMGITFIWMECTNFARDFLWV